MNYKKYKKYPKVQLENREWPNREIEKAPIWCSVDLRDGNQSLPLPMSVDEKVEFFNLLVEMGFKEIEVGFPSASETEFQFLRRLVDDKLIPDDVTIQVLVQCREALIKRTFEALEGLKTAIIHFYNSTSTLQRDIVFKKSKEEITKIAVAGASLIKSLESETETEIRYEYSPESFTGTELDYALSICEAVIDVIEPSEEKKLILNLPATVEMSTPNIYADQIEWFGKNIKNREAIIISLHAHNDRGTSIAASELGLLAGADRVEGTLLGNGERTGNVDLIALGMNMQSQGIDPKLNFNNMKKIADVYERVTKLPINPRAPYIGELVHTAFSGSHQDAIRKGFLAQEEKKSNIWEVPYLPIDPIDVGREYEAVIRINSQSGKGGIAFVMEVDFGYKMPKGMHPEFAKIIQKISDKTGRELAPEEIFDLFKKNYLDIDKKIDIIKYQIEEINDLKGETGKVKFNALFSINGVEQDIYGSGNGPIDACANTLREVASIDFKVISYDEHALTKGSNSQAVSYISIENSNGKRFYGVGMDQNIGTASIKALLCAINRSL